MTGFRRRNIIFCFVFYLLSKEKCRCTFPTLYLNFQNSSQWWYQLPKPSFGTEWLFCLAAILQFWGCLSFKSAILLYNFIFFSQHIQVYCFDLSVCCFEIIWLFIQRSIHLHCGIHRERNPSFNGSNESTLCPGH